MGVSQLVTNIVGVLSRLYTSNVYCAVVCTHMEYIVYMQVLNGCLAASNRQNWCPAASVYIYMYLQVCTVQFVCTHMTVHLFYRCLRGSNISNITF